MLAIRAVLFDRFQDQVVAPFTRTRCLSTWRRLRIPREELVEVCGPENSLECLFLLLARDQVGFETLLELHVSDLCVREHRRRLLLIVH